MYLNEIPWWLLYCVQKRRSYYLIIFLIIFLQCWQTAPLLNNGWNFKKVPFSFYPWCVFDHVLPQIIKIEHTKQKSRDCFGICLPEDSKTPQGVKIHVFWGVLESSAWADSKTLRGFVFRAKWLVSFCSWMENGWIIMTEDGSFRDEFPDEQIAFKKYEEFKKKNHITRYSAVQLFLCTTF